MSRAPGSRRRVENSEPPSWREQFAALRHVLPLLKLVWKTHRGYTSAIIILRLLQAFVPVVSLWVGKLIIDTVVAAQGSGDYSQLWRLVLIEIGVVVAGDVLSRASILFESLLGDLFSNYTSIRLMEHAATLDLYHFEDPSFYDQLERARRQTTNRIGLLALLLGIGSGILTLLSLSAALFVYSPWLLLLLVVSVLPSFFGETRMASLGYSLLFRWTPERRELDYLRYLGASDETAKEVQMFGLSRWVVDRYRSLSDRFYQENRKLSIKRAFVSSGLSFIGTLGYYTAYAVILFRAVQGAITLGSLTFLAGSFARSRDIIRNLLINASDIYSQSLYVKDLFDFFEMKPSIVSRPDARPVPQPIREGFVFEDVGFRYAGSDVWAVRNVSFHLRPGERIALVGENGAGKTTLTKLLARLYDPSEGRILLDGVDLRDYDLASVRQAIGVIFQDFVRYDLRFDENIGIGEVNKVRSYLDLARNGDGEKTAKASEPSTGAASTREASTSEASTREPGAPGNGSVPEPIVTAADKSLAASLLARFPEKYRQMLGRRFEGGVELSGGEWQKVALARAYMRDAQVLILDEPTAALDARAEYEVFTRFSELVSGRMAVIISHRFSTVRVADRIIVLKDGAVVEDGTHDELLARDGLYAELFTLQAEGYR